MASVHPGEDDDWTAPEGHYTGPSYLYGAQRPPRGSRWEPVLTGVVIATIPLLVLGPQPWVWAGWVVFAVALAVRIWLSTRVPPELR